MRLPQRLLFSFTLLIVFMLVLGCATNSSLNVHTPSPYHILSGVVFYPNDLYFPSRVRLDITLSATNIRQQSSTVIALQSIRNPQRFPVNFILRYDLQDIRYSDQYYLSVSLFREGEEKPYLSSEEIQLTTLRGDEAVVVHLNPVTL